MPEQQRRRFSIKTIASRIRQNDLALLQRQVVVDYLNEVQDILDNPLFRGLEFFLQHGATSRRQHSINVSYYSYRICRLLRLNARAAARAGLLHDLFFYQRQDRKLEDPNFNHVYDHPLDALENASKVCEISELEADIIAKHMFPLCYEMPRFIETFVVSFVDKIAATAEAFVAVGSYCRRGAKKVARYF